MTELTASSAIGQGAIVVGCRQEPRLDQMASDLRVDVVVIGQVKGDLAVTHPRRKVAAKEEDACEASGDGRSVVGLIERVSSA